MLTLKLVSDEDWDLQLREPALQRGGAVCLRPPFQMKPWLLWSFQKGLRPVGELEWRWETRGSLDR